MAVFSCRLDDDLYERLRIEAFRRRLPMSRLIVAALLRYLDGDGDAPA